MQRRWVRDALRGTLVRLRWRCEVGLCQGRIQGLQNEIKLKADEQRDTKKFVEVPQPWCMMSAL